MAEGSSGACEDTRELSWTRHDWAVVALLCVGTACALWYFWGRSPHLASDLTMAIYRSFELDRSIGQGVLYPRLAMDFNFTYGAPLLEYRPPLVHYGLLVVYWVVQNWIAAAKWVATLELLLGGLGLYVYARWLYANRRAALVSAAAYLLAPYLIGNIVERGSIGETAALAVLPWLCWTVHRILRGDGPLWTWLSALLTALLVLAHNIVAFFSMPFLLLYFGLLAWRERAWRRVPAGLLALAGGLGLSAFYWLPALLGRDDAQIATNLVGKSMQGQLTSFINLVQPQLAFDYWGKLRFHLGLWQAAVAIVAVLGVAAGPKRSRFNVGVLAGIAGIAMALQLDLSSVFWDNVPLVSYIQFPWRLLGVAAFAIALLAGSVLTWPRLAGLPGWIVTVGLAGVMLFAGTRMAGPEFYRYHNQLDEQDVSLDGLYDRGRSYFTLFSDFLPTGVDVASTDLVLPRSSGTSSLAALTSVPDIAVTGDRPFRLDLQVHAEGPFTLRAHRFYFPGWTVLAAGKPVPTEASGELGLVTADLPAGDYPVTVEFGLTPVHRAAEIVAAATLLAWLAAAVTIRRARPVLAGLAALALLAVGLMFVRHGPVGEAIQPVAVQADLGDDISLVGYHLPAETWEPGDDLPLRLYWLANDAPPDDYSVSVALTTPDDSATVAQSDGLPVRGASPTSRWEPGEVVVDDQTLHLDDDLAPGRYLLVASLHQSDPPQSLPASGTTTVLPGDRIVLTEVNVKGQWPCNDSPSPALSLRSCRWMSRPTSRAPSPGLAERSTRAARSSWCCPKR